MKLIESSVEILPQESGIEGIYKQIEIAARTCYKSESFIKEGSAEKMVNALIQREHGSPLEHGTVYLIIPDHEPDEFGRMSYGHMGVGNYGTNKYSRVTYRNYYQEPNETQKDYCSKIPRTTTYVTTNLRVLVENGWLDDLKYISIPTEYHEKRITLRMTCSRAVTHEVVRHRENMSYCQESQRYVNYNLDKFGNEITYIIPEWIYDVQSEEASYSHRDYLIDLKGEELVTELAKINDTVYSWTSQLKLAESCYMYLINDTKGYKLKPQEARGVLPNDCKTEIVITGSISAWKHFFNLRCAKAAHPDIRKIAWEIVDKFVELGYITEEERLNYVK